MEKDQVEITISLGRTINMGNYESARIDVSLRITGDTKNKDRIYKQAENWVDLKLTEKVESLTEEMAANGRIK